MRRLVVAGFLTMLAGLSPALAQAPQPAPPPAAQGADGKTNINIGAPVPARTGDEARWFPEDLKVYGKVASARSYAQLMAMEPELKTVMSHAPASFPIAETRPGIVIIRDRSEVGMAIGLYYALAEQKERPGGSVGVAFEDNVYGTAAMMLGSFAVERKDYSGALVWLDKGLAMQPDNPALIGERAHAVAMLGRNSEALAGYRSWERDYTLQSELDPMATARMQRGIGFVLGEQGKLAEAEAAYKRSLELEPNNPTALNELKYIAGLKQGDLRGAPESVRPADRQEP